MSNAQWLAWAREAVAAPIAAAPPQGLDRLDSEVLRALVALPFGQTTEITSVGAIGMSVASAESMPTMVRSAEDLQRDADDVDAAETLVHGERAALDREPLDVTLESPRGGLEVSLEPVNEDAGWYIPPLVQRSQASSPSTGTQTTIRGPAPTPVPSQDAVGSNGTVVAQPLAPATASAPTTTMPSPPSGHSPVAPGSGPSPAAMSGALPTTASSSTTMPAPPASSATIPAPGGAPMVASSGTVIAPAPTAPPAPASSADPQAAAIRTGNTLIPIEPESATTQTAGVIVMVADAAEPEPPPARRPSKVVIASSAEASAPAEIDGDDVLESSDLLEAEESPEAPALPTAPPAAPPAPPSRVTGEMRTTNGDVASVEPIGPATGITGQTLPPTASRHWSEAVFAGHYTALSRPSSPAMAAAEAAFCAEIAGIANTASVIDVGCGEGLHANAFSERGCRTVGLDCAQAMIDVAMEEFGPSVSRLRWICRDVRTPGFDETFDLVTCLGTTVGIYDEPDNAAVLASLRRLCAPNGRVVIQVVNRDYVVPRLPARTWWQGRGCLVLDEVDVNDRASRVQVKRTIVFEDGRQFEHLYSVRVYALHELVAAVENAGLAVLEVSGSRHTRGRYFGATSADIWLVAGRA